MPTHASTRSYANRLPCRPAAHRVMAFHQGLLMPAAVWATPNSPAQQQQQQQLRSRHRVILFRTRPCTQLDYCDSNESSVFVVNSCCCC
jgi:hypothetical protein